MTPLTRRTALFGACACCALATRRTAAAATDFTEIAPGMFFRRGLDAEASATNADAIANTGFIVGADSVAVIDPGGSLADGQALRAAIAAHTTRPVRFVVLSHVHPDHIFGAAAFTEGAPRIVGHTRLPAALGTRGEYYRRHLAELLGAEAAGSVVTPNLLVTDTQTLDLGDRRLTVRAHRPAHTDTDLTLFDAQTSTLITADLLFIGRVPSFDGDLKGWLAELDSLAAIRAARVVPGHGPVTTDWPAAAADLRRYLNLLLSETRAAIAAGVPIEQAATRVAATERGRWALFDDYNPRNVLTAYHQLEWE